MALCYEQHEHTTDLHLCLKPGQAVDRTAARRPHGGRLKYLLWRCTTSNINHSPTCTTAGLRAPMAPHYEGQEPSLGWPTGLHGMPPKLWRQRIRGGGPSFERIPPSSAPDNRDTPGGHWPQPCPVNGPKLIRQSSAHQRRSSMQLHRNRRNPSGWRRKPRLVALQMCLRPERAVRVSPPDMR